MKKIQFLSKTVFWLFCSMSIAACGGGSGGSSGSNTTQASGYRIDCPGTSNYTPHASPRVTLSTVGEATTSIIFMHGKSGTPNSSERVALYNDLAAAGFDVIAPYMPYGRNGPQGQTPRWNGTYCDGLTYIDQLVEQEAAKGRNVFVGGHSMGGVHALLYGVTEPPAAVKGLITIAPGHMPHISNNIKNTSAAGITLAEDLIAQGSGDVVTDFETYNTGGVEPLQALPAYYLSYHDLNDFPDILDVLPEISLPVLWLAGADDSLTTNVYTPRQLPSQMSSSNYEYYILDGGHTSVLLSSEAEITPWING